MDTANHITIKRRAVRSLLWLMSAAGVHAPLAASAHLVNTNVGEFYGGMMHPVTSLEHLLPTLALGLLASQCGKHAARWTLLMFPLALLAGMLTGQRLPPYGIIQLADIIALVGLGVLLAAGPQFTKLFPVEALALMVGLILGYRSGNDMAAAKVAGQFIPGVALSGLILLAIITAWVPVAASPTARAIRTVAGGVFTLIGIGMLIQLAASGTLVATRSVHFPGEQDLVATIKRGQLSAPIIIGALIGSMLWGAGHALTPGHGKTVVAAYLIGARGTAWHALYLGLTVTITHTFGIFVLGLIALFASHYLVPERLYPWLSAISGLIVVAMGALMLWQRTRLVTPGGLHHHDHAHADHQHHHHGHSHTHAHEDAGHSHSHLPPGAGGETVTWRSLLALGISGGILPCPSALVLLLAAVSLNRTAFGILLVLAFSLGLAGVLTAVGLLFVKGSAMLRRLPHFGIWSRMLPVASALIILLLGIGLTLEAFSKPTQTISVPAGDASGK